MIGQIVQVEFFDHTPFYKAKILSTLPEWKCKDKATHYLAVKEHTQALCIIVFWENGWVDCFPAN